MKRLDLDPIRRRLAEPVGARARKSALYVALCRARSDCADLVNEVERQRTSLVEVSMMLTRKIKELEAAVTGEPAP